jgi:hypothetical protein
VHRLFLHFFPFLFGFLPVRITQSPVLLLPPPPPVQYCTSSSEKLWIKKDSWHSRILLLIQYTHTFLWVLPTCVTLRMPEPFPLYPTEKYRSQRPGRAIGLSQICSILYGNMMDSTWST